jgi:hypothetical protein
VGPCLVYDVLMDLMSSQNHYVTWYDNFFFATVVTFMMFHYFVTN